MSLSGSTRRHVPRRLPPITEEAPIREPTCERCTTRYAVFGEHIACPVCGRLPALTIARDGLDAQEALLAVLEQLPTEVLAPLREGGALEKSAAGALGSVVSTVETFLKVTFIDRVAGGDALIAGKGNVFQRLDDATQLYRDEVGIDLRGAVGAAGWDRLLVLYGVRHLLTHNNGIIDVKHLAKFPGCGRGVGQRLGVSLGDAREAIRLARTLVSAV